MKPSRVLCLTLVLLLLGAAPPRTTIFGFTVEGSTRERQLEALFLDVPSAAGALETAGTIAAQSHYAGSVGDHQLALFMRDKLREYGFDATLETFTARVDTPRRLLLQLLPNGPGLVPRVQAAEGTAPELAPTATPVAATPTPTPRRRGLLKGRPPAPPLIASSRERRARGPETITLDLREPTPDVADATSAVGDQAIGPAGVGLPFNAGSADGNVSAPLVYASRGTAADYAALAAHDVDVQGAVVLIRYGAEFRGGLAARAQAHGAVGVIFYNDPADDGFARGPVYPQGPWRAPTSVERGTVGDGIRIPTLPISANNAQLLLGSLHGPPGGSDWRGALEVAYPYARGPGYVHLQVQLNRRQTTLWNTIGRIPGRRGAETVVLGAHRDAWVYGAGDNGSGVAALLELARGYGYLLQSGWRPTRTLVIAGWDAGELDNEGAQDYVRRHFPELIAGGVAYLNADEVAVGPRFAADAAAALGPALVDVVRSVEDPTGTPRSVFDAWAAQQRTPSPYPVAPGGGSDHAPFLFNVGTPTINMAFTGPFGGYDSSNDTLQAAMTFGDPGFIHHRAMAQLYGLLALRLADADVVPYAFSAYVPPMRAALAQLTAEAATARLTLDTASLGAAINAFATAAARFDALTARAADAEATESALAAARMLDRAAYAEDGYASNLFPALGGALASGDVDRAGATLSRTRDAIDQATRLLAGAITAQR